MGFLDRLVGTRKSALLAFIVFLIIYLYTSGSLPIEKYAILYLLALISALLIDYTLIKIPKFNSFLNQYKNIIIIATIASIFFMLKSTGLFATFSPFKTIGGLLAPLSTFLLIPILAFFTINPILAMVLVIGGILLIGIPLFTIGHSITSLIQANGTLLIIVVGLIIGSWVILKIFTK